ncbi:MAG: type III-B CRISPR-associated protein Cas10/Cmr2 [Blastocatellia bacterium]|nr:type III-B CRISPR-associated protein Cas10/Cmr2 [Blastocatellia bacterium]
MEYLFSLSLGPAQEFIAAARRTRDLWFSSWLLSELSKAAAREIGKERLIFPAVTNGDDLKPGSVFNVVNKILAIVDDDPQRIGDRAKTAVRKRLNDIRDRAFAEALKYLPPGFCKNKAEAQIDDLPEIYWAAVPLSCDYASVRRRVDALMSARKNTRDFSSTDKWCGKEWKSSLDGLRESVIPKAATGMRGVKKNEALCGVGLLKRFGTSNNYKEGEGFASVPHIAAWPLIQTFSNKHREVLKEYIEFLRAKHIDAKTALYCPDWPHSKIFPYDGHILFEEQLKEYFDENTQQTELDEARKKLRSLRNEIGPAPSPYYTILHGDGDRMGEAIDALKTVVDHRKLSQALSQFAVEAREIVGKYYGSLIYAGGDDVLALVPLSTVIKCASRLAETFKEKLIDFKNAEGNSPTFSIGIGISHQMDPLEDALRLAREAEKEAKTLSGKNGLCIKISKRSGTVTSVCDHWGALDERLNLFTTYHQDDEVPDDAAYELRRLADDLKDFPEGEKAEAYEREAARILSRKRSKHSAEAIKQSVRQKLRNCIHESSKETTKAFSAIADELIVARLFVNKFELKGETE